MYKNTDTIQGDRVFLLYTYQIYKGMYSINDEVRSKYLDEIKCI